MAEVIMRCRLWHDRQKPQVWDYDNIPQYPPHRNRLDSLDDCRRYVHQVSMLNAIEASGPVFLSHKNEDMLAVESLGKEMHRAGVWIYMDTKDPMVQVDSPDLVAHLRGVIKYCPALLAYVTPAAIQSWWIPLEIAFAMESSKTKNLATFRADRSVALPSYLWEWPILVSNAEAVAWGRMVKSNPDRVAEDWRRSLRFQRKSLDSPLGW